MTRFLASLFVSLFTCTALAQPYPSRPVKIIVPFGPGGTADTLGRLVAQKLSDQLKEAFVIENKGGAGGVVGSEQVAKAPPDGYTLLVSGIASHVISPLLPGRTPYDPLKDFTHIALFGRPPAGFPGNPSVPAKNPKEFRPAAEHKPRA